MISLWVVPAIPLLGFVLNGLFGKRLGKSFVSVVGAGTAASATVAAYSRLIPYLSAPATPIVERFGGWILAGSLSVDLSFRFLFLAVLVLGIAWAFSNVRVVPPDSRALVLRFGNVVRQESAGLLLALPQPMEQVVILPSADRQIELPPRGRGICR